VQEGPARDERSVERRALYVEGDHDVRPRDRRAAVVHRAVAVVVDRVRALDRELGDADRGAPVVHKPSPSSSTAFAHWAPLSPTPGVPPALGFATKVWSKASIGWHVPLCRKPIELVVGGPPPGSQSFNTHWSTLSAPAEVAENA